MRMRRGSAIWCVVLLIFTQVALGASAPKKPKWPPLKTESDEQLGFMAAPREETLAHIKRLGMLEPRLPVYFEGRDDVKQALESLLLDYLRKSNIDAVGSQAYTSILDRLNHEVGGIYDSKTGAMKGEVAKAVYMNARREYAESEHLDGYVFVRVEAYSAILMGGTAYWDDVREVSTGPVDPIYTNMRGTLPALSLVLQIYNSEDKLVFGRACGIQLIEYYEPIHGGFVAVPPEKLLKDVPRLERAVRFATLPLRLTPQEIATHADNPKVNPEKLSLKDLPEPPPGELPKEPNPFLVPRDEILKTVHRVALASFSSGDYALPAEAQERYLALIRGELGKLGWQVVDAPRAREIFKEQLQNVDVVDPYTGKRNEEALKLARKAVFADLGTNPPDAILWPFLRKTVAAHDNGDAQWDGVSQNARDLGPARSGFFKNYGLIAVGQGGVGAVSLVVRLANAADENLYEARGGIQLTQQFKKTELEDLAPQELFRDQSREPLAVHAALRALVLSPEELDAELHPGKKRDKKK